MNWQKPTFIGTCCKSTREAKSLKSSNTSLTCSSSFKISCYACEFILNIMQLLIPQNKWNSCHYKTIPYAGPRCPSLRPASYLTPTPSEWRSEPVFERIHAENGGKTAQVKSTHTEHTFTHTCPLSTIFSTSLGVIFLSTIYRPIRINMQNKI